ncbi:ABC transporter substrate-binding protein [Bradyrhizobium sp. CB82]|uniref:ABC transporter substrate-binding protein n=1 Tax=Bradyrhizobium sp. CB82 TaxID=3039159 RepID=UPI0024B2646F|nr:ABC transporter substrate-binding protein [Bradyrhizobium sp. CB82]WFU37349.1 ABC transporter substrate-binding protein [Bradyrhizobium sp. CB82]
MAIFAERLRALGWLEGRDITIEYRWARGYAPAYSEIAAEFVRLNVDLIVTSGTAPVLAAKQATSVIPIVFAAAGDPVGTGLVASLSRPGCNVTGLSLQQRDLAPKRMALLREVMPTLREVAILANIGSAGAVLDMHEAEAAARTLGISSRSLEIRQPEHIEPALHSISGRAQALYVVIDPLINTERKRINALALKEGFGTMHATREHAEADGLMSYGASYPDLWRRTADLVDKILRGTKAADIPVEQPTKFDLVINLKTAKALGLSISPTLLARADDVIE